MPAPALSIPVRANLDTFKKQMTETSSLAQTAARKVTQQFLEMNKGMASGAASAMFLKASRDALGFAGKVAIVIGSLKLMGDAVGAARNQLKQMVEIADKSSSTNFSPEFWQNWVNGAKGAEKQVELFEDALHHAFQALKPVLNPDWTVWDDGLKKVTAVEQAMREMRELFTTDQDFSGFALFKNAKTQDEQTAAVLTYMKQLQAIGHDIAAIDLGEKLFGSRFADQLRTGKVSVNQLLDDIKTKSEDAFSNEIVKRAKAIDDELKNAWRTVSQNLHPSLEALDGLFLDFKSVWVEIVKLLGQAAALWNQLRPASRGADGLTAFQNDVRTSLMNKLRDPGLTPTQRRGLEAQLAQAEANLVPQAPTEFDLAGGDKGTPQTSAVPLPRRRPDSAPKPGKPETPAGQDRFDTSADVIEKRTAALQAEAGAIDLGTAAREKARIVAQLETVARQANAAAGKGENVVTEEQRKRIDEVANAYARAAEEIERAKIKLNIKIDRATAFLTPEDAAIARELAGLYQNDIPAALASTEAAAMRANNTLRSISQLGQEINRGFLTDFTQQIRNGASAMEALQTAGLNALNRIADKLIQMAADNLWSAAFGGKGGFNLFSLLGGGGGVGMAQSMSSTGLSLTGTGGLYAGGGYTGPGGVHEPRGVVHAGEVVWSQRDVARAGGVGVVEAMRLGRRGYDAGGVVSPAATLQPSGPSAPAASSSVSVSMGDTQIIVQGNADDRTIDQMRTELAKRDKEFSARVIAAVKSGQRSGMLSR